MEPATPLLMAAPSPPQGADAPADLSQLQVVSVHDAQPVLLTSLWADRPRTIVVFLRHWMVSRKSQSQQARAQQSG